MDGLTPTNTDLDSLLSQWKGYDLYTIGTQECLRSILQSIFYSVKSIWENLLEQYFGNDYYILIQNQNLSPFHIIVIKRLYLSHISKIESDFERDVGNMVGNKEAASIWINLMGVSRLFINSHLAAGKGYPLKRNENFEYIYYILFFLINQLM